MKIEYIVKDLGMEYPDDAYLLQEGDFQYSEDDAGSLAEEAADNFYSEHDGWECKWPLKFEIFMNGKSVGVFSVECDFNPEFTAYEEKSEVKP